MSEGEDNTGSHEARGSIPLSPPNQKIKEAAEDNLCLLFFSSIYCPTILLKILAIRELYITIIILSRFIPPVYIPL